MRGEVAGGVLVRGAEYASATLLVAPLRQHPGGARRRRHVGTLACKGSSCFAFSPGRHEQEKGRRETD
jgi:hypothetical protein